MKQRHTFSKHVASVAGLSLLLTGLLAAPRPAAR